MATPIETVTSTSVLLQPKRRWTVVARGHHLGLVAGSDQLGGELPCQDRSQH